MMMLVNKVFEEKINKCIVFVYLKNKIEIKCFPYDFITTHSIGEAKY